VSVVVLGSCLLNYCFRLPALCIRFVVADHHRSCTSPHSYEGVEVKYIGGRSPDILFLDEDAAVVEKISLTPFTTEECIALLTDRGFQLKDKVSRSRVGGRIGAKSWHTGQGLRQDLRQVAAVFE